MKKNILLLITFLLFISANAQNLLINPSFTTWTGVDGTNTPPDSWNALKRFDSATFFKSTDTPTGSGTSWEIVMVGSRRIVEANQVILPPNGLSEFDATRTYRISISVKQKSGVNTNAAIWCKWFASDGITEITPFIDKYDGGANMQKQITAINEVWSTFTYNCVPPAGAKYFHFSFYTYGASTLLWANPSFEAIPQISVTSNDITKGTVSGGGQYEIGASVTVVATAKTGSRFVNWTENGIEVSTDASYTFTYSGDRNLVANFLPDTSTSSQNLLVNPDFTSWSGYLDGTGNDVPGATKTCPDGWLRNYGGSSDLDGSALFTRMNDTPTGTGISWKIDTDRRLDIKQYVPSPEGAGLNYDINKKYKVTIYYKVLFGDGTDAKIWCNWLSSATGTPNVNIPLSTADSYGLNGPGGDVEPRLGEYGDNTNGYLYDNRLDGTWSSYSYITSPPPSAKQFIFGFRTYTRGIVLWADPSFVETTTTEVKSTDSEVKIYVRNESLQLQNVAIGTVLEIYSIEGKKVQQAIVTSSFFQLENLKKGIYIVKVGTLSTKIVF